MNKVDPDFVDNGDRSNSKVDKGDEAPEIEIVNRQMAPKVSVKVERQQNLGHYNNATAQVFMSSGTIEKYRGSTLNKDGEVRDDLKNELAEISKELEKLARNRVLDALKKHAKAGVDVNTDIHDVSSGGGH